MAVYGFRGLGWFLCGVIVAPTCYMVTSHGAAERAKLRAMDSAIVQAHKDIRGLETEFDTRANMAQIERWNGDVLAMNAPQPQQYLASASGLAALDQPAPAVPGDAKVETAALVIPTGQRPVETAAAAQPVATAAAAPVKTVAARPVQTASAAPVKAAPVKSTVVRVAQSDTKPGQDLDRLIRKIDKARLAQPDRPLLSAATISDLRRVAKREQTAQR
ncbi:hypothetical protein CA233_01020 [Sphingomonas sp. ABOLD]|uniref:Uncharacterized protein n=1 Tax=Sphingomonas trueperi TaxID=53317 RepID=A0A7X5XZF6_9SPHN|nr:MULTISPECIES: hypothetical protein [Sphingomonas]NJB97798.1 hypothetical protein [Sphingomonas trueperi]RSV52983.1 hypothetical protein CA233_01020 [Sphingomonas sp. ABOLD]